MNMSHSLLRWLELAVFLQVRFCQERVFLEGFDPLPFCFPVPHFAYFRQVHLLMASEYSATVAGCSSYDLQDLCYWLHEDPCVDQVQHTLNAAASLHACRNTHISAKIFRDGTTGILGALSSIMWWEQDGMVIYSPSSLNKVATTPIVMNIYSSKIWLHWTWKTHLTSLSRASKHGIHYTFLWASWKLNIQSNHGKFWSELCIHFSPTKHFQLMWNSIFRVLIYDKNKNKKM